MDSHTFETALTELYLLRPFEIFTITLKSGETIQIDHPMALAYSEGMGVFKGPGGRFKYFDYNSVVSLDKEKASVH